jgi:hypothetical protein
MKYLRQGEWTNWRKPLTKFRIIKTYFDCESVKYSNKRITTETPIITIYQVHKNSRLFCRMKMPPKLERQSDEKLRGFHGTIAESRLLCAMKTGDNIAKIEAEIRKKADKIFRQINIKSSSWKSFGFQKGTGYLGLTIYFRRWHLPFSDCAFDWFYVLVQNGTGFHHSKFTVNVNRRNHGLSRHSTETVDDIGFELHLDFGG